ncbi:gamma-1-syntrophin [Daktulosphaira vitifoliae]|uniref:gamma-1-syntrophin n=1 Tax=Daktulosphaira vitifoliae TaxID=58002 RepID=UPI0021A9814B|nr:gamma-1-syntrophin [Daktulosphaira vitifoliae]
MRLNLNINEKSDIKEEIIDGLKAKTGLVRINDSNKGSLIVRLVLTLECLKLQKKEEVDNFFSSSAEDNIDNQPSPNYYLRYVTVTRKNGSLGISVKGGRENSLPILISKIPEGGAAHYTKRLFVGDAIIKVNDNLITNVCHDEALRILRSSGQNVTLLVKHYKAAAPFLLGSKGNDNNNNEDSENDDEEIWTDFITIPLMMGYVTRYVQGTDKLRRNGFEVHGMNGSNSSIIHCDNVNSLSEWIKFISENIDNLAEIQIKLYNLNFGINEKIEYMGWVNEGVLNNNHPWQSYCARFMIIRGRDVLLFDTPPMSIAEWLDCEVVYKLYESMLRLVKDSENVDQRQNCFLLQTSSGVSRYFSMETRQSLHNVQCAWHRSICTSMMNIKSRTFYVLYGNNQQPSNLILDWDNGFTLYDNWTNSNVWIYKFSELRGSSDDHISRLKLHFNNAGCIETKELVCQDLQSLLFCVHAFLTAKVVSVDPSYLNLEGKQ